MVLDLQRAREKHIIFIFVKNQRWDYFKLGTGPEKCCYVVRNLTVPPGSECFLHCLFILQVLKVLLNNGRIVCQEDRFLIWHFIRISKILSKYVWLLGKNMHSPNFETLWQVAIATGWVWSGSPHTRRNMHVRVVTHFLRTEWMRAWRTKDIWCCIMLCLCSLKWFWFLSDEMLLSRLQSLTSKTKSNQTRHSDVRWPYLPILTQQICI